VTIPNKTERSWGYYQVIYQDDHSWTKALTIYGGESLSLHYHEFRRELWFPIDTGLVGVINGSTSLDLAAGHVYSVSQNVVHRIINPTEFPKRLIEVARGAVRDDDIIRIYDKYGS
jgi:mannose-6-phosphate isomerase-like protein (cupin superfamily)